ncbi:MAG TPA: FAD-containing oxidoreductase [Burkholderiales bacterium]|nr:FAD-containing oxidoreductase [Burkholderiales bacterium]
MPEQFDAIVIGAGQAGPALCARLNKEGLKTAMVERHLLGGTCVNNGCIPTKTLVASARALHVARRGSEFGFSMENLKTDMGRIKARKDAVVKHSSDGLADWFKQMKHVTLIHGHARFTAEKTVAVDGRELRAEKIFINVGGRAAVPDMPGIRDVPFLNNNSMMRVDVVPEHLVIVGGSYIGLEFAQMYRRFGSQVTVVERAAKLLPREDDDVTEEIKAILGREGVELRTGAECMSFRKNGGRISVELDCKGAAPVAEGTHLLLAVGRKPNTDDLDLHKAGVEMDERGYIKVDDECRTNVDGVWALGDCNGRGAFTHTSYNDYEIVAANLFDSDKRRISDRIMTYALFIDPPLGRAGMNEAEAKKSGKKVLRGKLPMARVGRAREAGETQGFMKVLVDADSKELLGASLLGLNADEIVHSLLDVMYAKKPYTTIQRAVHIHPTVSELVPTLLGSLKPLMGSE